MSLLLAESGTPPATPAVFMTPTMFWGPLLSLLFFLLYWGQ